MQFFKSLSANRENIEVHLNEFVHCSCCVGNSPWAEISVKTPVIYNENN